MMEKFDREPNILRWQSEEQKVLYRSPVDGRMHNYILDFCFWSNTKDGLQKFMVEVKPKDQVLEPKKRATETDYSFRERVKEYLINKAKWDAARKQAEVEGAKFIILTEEQIMPSQHSIKPYRHPKVKVKNGNAVSSRVGTKQAKPK